MNFSYDRKWKLLNMQQASMQTVPAILLETKTVPEKIAERNTIVYKSRLDFNTIKFNAEKMKNKLFTRFIFLKPKTMEIRVVSIDKYYEPFVIVEGEYTINYSKRWVHKIEVEETLQEITLFGKKLKPKPLGNLGMPCKILKLSGEGYFSYNNKKRLIFDRLWREVGLEHLPYAPFEEHPEKILKKHKKKYGNTMIPPKKEIAIIRSRIIQKPLDIKRIHKELFTISENSVIYKPMYKFTFQNTKTGKEAPITIDAVTGQTYQSVSAQAPINLNQLKDLKDKILAFFKPSKN